MQSSARNEKSCATHIRTAVAVMFIGLATGCATGGYRVYPGRQLAREEVALLISGEGHNLKLQAIDGKRGPNHGDFGYSSAWDLDFRVELLPGEHTLTFHFSDTGPGYFIYSWDPVEVKFVARPGYLYKATASVVQRNWKVKLEELGPIPKNYERPRKVAN